MIRHGHVWSGGKASKAHKASGRRWCESCAHFSNEGFFSKCLLTANCDGRTYWCSRIKEEKMEKNCETCYYRDFRTDQCHSVNPCNKLSYSEWYPRVKEEKVEDKKKEYKWGEGWGGRMPLTPVSIFSAFENVHNCDSFWRAWDLFLDRFPDITHGIPLDGLVSWIDEYNLHESFIKRGIIERVGPPREKIKTGSLWELDGEIYIFAVLAGHLEIGLTRLRDGYRWSGPTMVSSLDNITDEDVKKVMGSGEFKQITDRRLLLLPKNMLYPSLEQYVIKRKEVCRDE